MNGTRAFIRRAVMLGLVGFAALALSGCYEGTDRPLSFGEKGKYAGKPDTPLPEEARKALRQRNAQQRF